MKLISVFLALWLVYPLVHAGEDNTGIAFRVTALEEITFLQQEQIEALSKWVIVAHPESGPEIVIGKVVSFTLRPQWVVVEADISGTNVLLWINSNGFIAGNSELVFASGGCSGDIYARVPDGWWFNKVYIAVGPGQVDSAVPYVTLGEPDPGPWGSHIAPNGECEDGDFGFAASPVAPLSDDLYILYPRAPSPWTLEVR